MSLVQFYYLDDRAAVAVVADDTHAEYIWPDDDARFMDGEAHLALLIDVTGASPTDAAGWLELAGHGLGRVEATEEFEAASFDAGVAQARAAFAETGEESSPSPAAASVGSSFDETFIDYPKLGADEEDTDPAATLTLVLQALGPIDPEGPNGWILRAMDGTPREGDESMGVTL